MHGEPNLQMSRGMTNAIAIAAIAFAKETKMPWGLLDAEDRANTRVS
jgi:hypothetical protein